MNPYIKLKTVKSTRFFREYLESESEVAQLCPTLCDPMDCNPWNFPGKGTGVGGHFPSPLYC